MRILVLLVVCVFSSCSSGDVRNSWEQEEWSFSDAAVRIHIDGEWTGSGVLIVLNRQQNLAVVLTAAHLWQGHTKECLVEVWQPVGEQWAAAPGILIRIDLDADLALVKTYPSAFRGKAPLATSEDIKKLVPGTKVKRFGFWDPAPTGELSTGVIVSLKRMVYEDIWPLGNLTYTAPTSYGTSGSGVAAFIENRWLIVSVHQGHDLNQEFEEREYVGAVPEVLLKFLGRE